VIVFALPTSIYSLYPICTLQDADYCYLGTTIRTALNNVKQTHLGKNAYYLEVSSGQQRPSATHVSQLENVQTSFTT
jgi:hypothetical protein